MNRKRTWTQIYQQCGAYWLHDNNPQRPHVVLSSGKHSDGFFASHLVMQNPVLADNAALSLVSGIDFADGSDFFCNVTRIIAPAMGAITLGHDLARRISTRYKAHRSGMACLCAHVVKASEGAGKQMAFDRIQPDSSEYLAVAEDVLTTGESTEAVIDLLEKNGNRVAPFIFVLVNRSGKTHIRGKKIIALVSQHMPIWASADCPLCQAGSEAIAAKVPPENWARLNAKYD